METFWGKLRRRKVVRVAIAYAIGAWVLLQVGDTVPRSAMEDLAELQQCDVFDWVM